jgi:hypothetical protein
MNVPACVIPVQTMFRPVFSSPTYHRFLILMLAAILTTGRRTVTNLLRTVRYQAQGHASSYHRVFSRRRWSTWALARALITFLLDHVVPPGPVLLAGDDTVTEHPGPKVFGKGRHRDGVRSTHSYTAYRWGHKWVVIAMLLKLPFAPRPWALPVLVALYRPPEWDRVHGTRHRTPAHLARLLLARLIRWFPHRHFIFVGDTGYGTSETARFCRQHRRHLTLVSKFYGDAALYEPPPPRTPHTMGRPRVKGQKLPSPQAVVAHRTNHVTASFTPVRSEGGSPTSDGTYRREAAIGPHHRVDAVCPDRSYDGMGVSPRRAPPASTRCQRRGSSPRAGTPYLVSTCCTPSHNRGAA